MSINSRLITEHQYDDNINDRRLGRSSSGPVSACAVRSCMDPIVAWFVCCCCSRYRHSQCSYTCVTVLWQTFRAYSMTVAGTVVGSYSELLLDRRWAFFLRIEKKKPFLWLLLLSPAFSIVALLRLLMMKATDAGEVQLWTGRNSIGNTSESAGSYSKSYDMVTLTNARSPQRFRQMDTTQGHANRETITAVNNQSIISFSDRVEKRKSNRPDSLSTDSSLEYSLPLKRVTRVPKFRTKPISRNSKKKKRIQAMCWAKKNYFERCRHKTVLHPQSRAVIPFLRAKSLNLTYRKLLN